MKIFFDTNVLLDVLVPRENRLLTEESAEILDILHPSIDFCISVLSVTTCAYYLRKDAPREQKRKLSELFEHLTIVPVSEDDWKFAYSSNLPDIEDAMQISVALNAGCSLIITRNVRHFSNQFIEVMTPAQFIEGVSMD